MDFLWRIRGRLLKRHVTRPFYCIANMLLLQTNDLVSKQLTRIAKTELPQSKERLVKTSSQLNKVRSPRKCDYVLAPYLIVTMTGVK